MTDEPTNQPTTKTLSWEAYIHTVTHLHGVWEGGWRGGTCTLEFAEVGTELQESLQEYS